MTNPLALATPLPRNLPWGIVFPHELQTAFRLPHAGQCGLGVPHTVHSGFPASCSHPLCSAELPSLSSLTWAPTTFRKPPPPHSCLTIAFASVRTPAQNPDCSGPHHGGGWGCFLTYCFVFTCARFQAVVISSLPDSKLLSAMKTNNKGCCSWSARHCP